MNDDERRPDDAGEQHDDADLPDDRWQDADADEQDEWPPGEGVGGTSMAVLAGTFISGVATALVLVLAWGALTGGDPTGAADGSGADLAGRTLEDGSGESGLGDAETGNAETGDAEGTPSTRPAPGRVARCTRASQALQESLRAARPALDQWRVHVGAMNKLVVGELTLQQATDFWERTRVGAQRRVGAYRDAMSSLRRRGVDCPRPGFLGAGSRALAPCARRVDAELRVVRSATTSVDMWDRHIHHMDMLRLGELSAEDATRMWLSMWQQGVRELDEYRLVARRAARMDLCGG